MGTVLGRRLSARMEFRDLTAWRFAIGMPVAGLIWILQEGAPVGISDGQDGLAMRFVVTDGPEDVTVEYVGILPDLFREGQGVIARGALNGAGLFEASEVLAKHDENYMPPEVADALEQSGHVTRSVDEG